MIWMMDVDGVLARFNRSMVRLLESVTGKTSTQDAESDEWVTQWWWLELAGFSREDWTVACETIVAAPSWWQTLRPYPCCRAVLAALLERESRGDQVYFVTSREPSQARWHTIAWLDMAGFPKASVILATEEQHKGDIARAIRADVAVDDKPENLIAIGAVQTCRLVLVDRPWNRTSNNGETRVTEDLLAHAIRSWKRS